MKTGILVLFIFFSLSAGAQNKAVDKVVQKFVLQFNQANYDDIYETFSAQYKQKVSKKALKMYMSNIHKIITGFKSLKFVSADGKTFNYFFVCNDDKTKADFHCMLDDDGKFDYLSFKRIGGTSNAPPVGKVKH